MKQWIEKVPTRKTQANDMDAALVQILNNRELVTEEEMTEFLSENPVQTHDPFLLKGMQASVDKILKAIKEGKKICIYGDYDVDGVSATCLLYEFLSGLTSNLMWYIPSRFEEGYGLNQEALKSISKDADMVITVDCGSVSYKEAAYAQELGMDIIITDHHNLGDQQPNCIMINPRQEDCNYPFADLCGCGVAFKLAQGIQRSANLKKSTISSLLDLVAIGTVADVVPLSGENRTLVKFGLKTINGRKRKGLKLLLDAIGLGDKEVKSYDIAFGIGPHINAGGRVENAKTGLMVLLSQDDAKAQTELATAVKKLVENNATRRTLQREGYEKCIKLIGDKADKHVILIADDEIHEGVAGIIAGKLKEKFYRPCIVMSTTEEGGVLKGTGRSIPEINLYEMLSTQRELFLKFGGHKAACGFSLPKEKESLFKESLEEEAEKIYNQHPEFFEEYIYYEADLTHHEIGITLAKNIERLEPYGHKNEKPLFRIQGLCIEKLFYMGAEKNHVKLTLRTKGNKIIEGVMFGISEEIQDNLCRDTEIELVGSISVNRWKGNESLQVIIEDFKIWRGNE